MMYGINLHGQNLTGDFKGFALKRTLFMTKLNDAYQLNLIMDEDDILVLLHTRRTVSNDLSISPLTPPGIALRSKRENEKVELAASAGQHYVSVAVFSPTYRKREEYGIEVYNERGEIAYGSADYYLTPVAEVELPFGKSADFTRQGMPPPEPIHFDIPRGKMYGVVIGSWGTGSANLTKSQINSRLSSHPMYRDHNFYYFGYYCSIVNNHNGGQIQFRLGSSGVPPEQFYGRGRLPTSKALIVDITDLPF